MGRPRSLTRSLRSNPLLAEQIAEAACPIAYCTRLSFSFYLYCSPDRRRAPQQSGSARHCFMVLVSVRLAASGSRAEGRALTAKGQCPALNASDKHFSKAKRVLVCGVA